MQIRHPRSRPSHPSTLTSSQKPASSDAWILRYHDIWSRVTLHTFHNELTDHSLSPIQFTRWLFDRTAISIALLRAATRLSLRLQAGHTKGTLPLLQAAEDHARVFTELLAIQEAKERPKRMSGWIVSHAAKKLIDLLEASTAPDASMSVGISAVWAFMFMGWQAWTLRKKRKLPGGFDQVVEQVTGRSCMMMITDTQELLDKRLERVGVGEYEKAGKTFEEVGRRLCAVLDYIVEMGGGVVPICECGRKGHRQENCTFKSHI